LPRTSRTNNPLRVSIPSRGNPGYLLHRQVASESGLARSCGFPVVYYKNPPTAQYYAAILNYDKGKPLAELHDEPAWRHCGRSEVKQMGAKKCLRTVPMKLRKKNPLFQVGSCQTPERLGHHFPTKGYRFFSTEQSVEHRRGCFCTNIIHPYNRPAKAPNLSCADKNPLQTSAMFLPAGRCEKR
jgi:hypothetical protein